MDDQDRLEKKVDKILERVGSIDVTIGKQQVSLDEHIRRTNLLEVELKPVKRHVFMVEGALKLIGVLAALAAIVEVLLQAVHG